MRFLLRRFFHGVISVFGVSILSFALADLAPGDFYSGLRLDSRISPQSVTAIRARHGLTEPLPARYGAWVRSILAGDWGYSFAYNGPAGPILWLRARNTLLLSGSATLFAWLLALPLGTLAAAYAHSWFDRCMSLLAALLVAIPELVLGLLLLLFALRSGVLPIGGFLSVNAETEGAYRQSMDVARHMILPVLCLTAGLLPLLLSHVRNAVADSLGAPFITAARGYGIPFARLLLTHALPAAANPLISLFGLSVGLLLSSSLLIETLFNWPGLGQLMVEALFQRDLFLVIDAALLASCFLIAGNFLADCLLLLSDARIRVA